MTPDVLLRLANQIEAANRTDLAESHESATVPLSNVLAYVRALSWCYQAAHWQTRGSTFYADHLLFERLYKETDAQVDGLAEKAVGLAISVSSAAVDPVDQSTFVAVVKQICGTDTSATSCAPRMLAAEKAFLAEFMPAIMLGLEHTGHLTDGLENALQGLMDEHESFVYLLEQRCKA